MGKGLIVSGSLWGHALGHPPSYTSQKLVNNEQWGAGVGRLVAGGWGVEG